MSFFLRHAVTKHQILNVVQVVSQAQWLPLICCPSKYGKLHSIACCHGRDWPDTIFISQKQWDTAWVLVANVDAAGHQAGHLRQVALGKDPWDNSW